MNEATYLASLLVLSSMTLLLCKLKNISAKGLPLTFNFFIFFWGRRALL